MSEKSEFIKKINSTTTDPVEKRRVTCALLGHSKVVELCFGYVSCARCDAQIGDTLAGAFNLTECVIVGHECKGCKTSYAALTWRDKLYVENPFSKKEGVA